jgi:hypothetical protein
MNVFSTIRNSRQLRCTWVPTGDSRTPLVCVWKEASPSLVTHTDQSSLADDIGGIGLCA